MSGILGNDCRTLVLIVVIVRTVVIPATAQTSIKMTRKLNLIRRWQNKVRYSSWRVFSLPDPKFRTWMKLSLILRRNCKNFTQSDTSRGGFVVDPKWYPAEDRDEGTRKISLQDEKSDVALQLKTQGHTRVGTWMSKVMSAHETLERWQEDRKTLRKNKSFKNPESRVINLCILPVAKVWFLMISFESMTLNCASSKLFTPTTPSSIM